MKLNKALMVAMSSVVGLFANSDSTDLIADRPSAYPNPHASQHGDRHNQQKVDQPDQRIHLAFAGDYLYWQPYFSNLPFAQRVPVTIDPQQLSDATGVQSQGYAAQNFQFSGDSGFRIGAEYTSDWNNFGLDFEWTSFHTAQTNRVSDTAPLSSGITPAGYTTGFLPHYANAWQYGASSNASRNKLGNVHSVKSDMKIKFDSFDYKVSTFYRPATWAQLKFGLGIRNVFTNLSMRNTFQGNKWGMNDTTVPVSQPPYNTLVERSMQTYDTIGPVMTANGKVDIVDGFRFVNGMGLSYQVGQLKNRLETSLSGNGGTVVSGFKNYKTTIKPMYDLDLGLQYEYLNDDKTLGLLLEFAYEIHVLPDFMQFAYQERAAGNVDQMWTNPIVDVISDISMQGFRARAGFSF